MAICGPQDQAGEYWALKNATKFEAKIFAIEYQISLR